jgi:hypothetical protein
MHDALPRDLAVLTLGLAVYAVIYADRQGAIRLWNAVAEQVWFSSKRQSGRLSISSSRAPEGRSLVATEPSELGRHLALTLALATAQPAPAACRHDKPTCIPA